MEPIISDRRVSLRDIGKALGISHVSVSLALRDKGAVSEKLRTEVKRMAEALGYQPDPMLSSLARYRMNKSARPVQAVMGWINAWQQPDKLRSLGEFDAYWKGASSAAGKLGYHLEEFRLGGDVTPECLHRILSARGIRALLLPPHQCEPNWGSFPWEKYYVVRFGNSLHTPQTHLVTADQTMNTSLAFEKILERGYQRIGFVTNEVHMKVRGHLFEAGYLIAQKSVEEKRRLPVFSFVGMKPSQAGSNFSTWLKQYRPDAIITDVPDILKILDTLGLQVPDDIAVAATTVIDTAVDAGIDQHPEEIGRVGTLLLNSIINDGACGTPRIFRRILIEGSWVQGGSMPPKSIPAMPKRKPKILLKI